MKLDAMKNAAADLHPLGKVLTMPGLETDDEDGNELNFMFILFTFLSEFYFLTDFSQ